MGAGPAGGNGNTGADQGFFNSEGGVVTAVLNLLFS